MLKIGARTRYGIAALVELAKEYGHGYIGLKKIAERRDIPLKFLEQIVGDLAKAGLLKTARGSEGGYQLADSPDGVTLYQVMEALEMGPAHRSAVPMDPVVSNIFREAENLVRQAFQVTLEEVAAREQGPALTYQI